MNKILLLILLIVIFIIQLKQNNQKITEPFIFGAVGNFFEKDVGGAVNKAVDTVGGGIQDAIKWATRLPGIFGKQISLMKKVMALMNKMTKFSKRFEGCSAFGEILQKRQFFVKYLTYNLSFLK